MKILTLTSSFPNYEDSYEGIFIGDLVKELSRHNVTPVIIAPHFPDGKLHEQWGNVRVNRFRYFFPTRYERLAYGSGFVVNLRNNTLAFFQVLPFCFGLLFSSLYFVSKQKPDLVHSHWLLPQGFAGALLHRLTGLPHVATIHGSDLNLIKNNRILKKIAHFIVRNSDLITVNSRYMKQQFLALEPTCSEKTVVIPMGVDPDRFGHPGIISRKKGFGTDNLILSIGRLIDWKGTNFLIEALPEVRKKVPDARLLIIGSGPEKDNLVRRTSELNLNDAVVFLGNVSGNDMLAYYRSADVFVLPSINKGGRTEGLGVVLLEAMASGCPVIGSNVGGIPDIIRDGMNGFLVPEQNSAALAEKIVRILTEKDLKEKFRNAGFARVQESFSWETVAEQFLGVYSRISGKT